MRYLLLLMLSFLIETAFSQQTSDKKTLDECIQIALKNNLNIQQTELNVFRNRNTYKQSQYNMLPDLNAFANQNYNFGRSIDPFTNLFTTDPVRNNNISLNASINLFSGLQAQNTVKQSRANLEASVFDYEKMKNDITLNVIQAYMQVLFNLENLENAKLQQKGTSEQLERTDKLVNAGSLPIGSLLDIKAQKASDDLALINAENSYYVTLLNLKQLMNIPATELFDIVYPELDDPDEEDYPASAEEVYQVALNNQPDIKSADVNVRSASLGVKIAKGAYYPTLTASASSNTFYSSQGTESSFEVTSFGTPQITGFTSSGDTVYSLPEPVISRTVRERTFTEQFDFNRRESLGFSLRIPIFNRFQSRTNVGNAKIAFQNAELNAQIVRNRLRQTIEQSHNDVKAAFQRYYAAKNQLGAREEAFRSAEQRFNVGMMNSVDFILAQNNLNRSRSELLQSKFDYIFKTKILDFYQNKPIGF